MRSVQAFGNDVGAEWVASLFKTLMVGALAILALVGIVIRGDDLSEVDGLRKH